MTKLILSTSNLMTGTPSIPTRPGFEKSNIELINGLRANFLVSKQAYASTRHQAVNGDARVTEERSREQWTARRGSSLFVPRLDFNDDGIGKGLAEADSQYDVTAKLFFLPATSAAQRCQYTQEAVELVLKELCLPSINLLIVSFPGVSFDADDEEENGEEGAQQEQTDGDERRDIESMVRTWSALEHLYDQGQAQQLGLAEFSTERLKKFLPRTRIKPAVDQINVRDCCVVPKPLILYAKEEKIQLLTHNDCTNILSSGTIRELLGGGENGAGILGDAADGMKGDIKPQWVIKYTAVVRDRGVIENKGYFAMAELED